MATTTVQDKGLITTMTTTTLQGRGSITTMDKLKIRKDTKKKIQHMDLMLLLMDHHPTMSIFVVVL